MYLRILSLFFVNLVNHAFQVHIEDLPSSLRISAPKSSPAVSNLFNLPNEKVSDLSKSVILDPENADSGLLVKIVPSKVDVISYSLAQEEFRDQEVLYSQPEQLHLSIGGNYLFILMSACPHNLSAYVYIRAENRYLHSLGSGSGKDYEIRELTDCTACDAKKLSLGYT